MTTSVVGNLVERLGHPGVDYASIDGNSPPDFAKFKAAGGKYVYIRKFQRVIKKDYPDPHYARDVDNARKAGLVVGGYIFPSFSIHATTPKEQIRAFRNAPGTILDGKDLPPCLDVEPGGAGWQATGRSKPELVALLEMFVRELEDAFSCKPMIYTSYNQWYDIGLPKAPWISNCPLWIKTAYRLKERRPVDTLPPREPHIGYDRVSDEKNFHRVPDPWASSGWFIQQTQGDALGMPGFNKTVDVNRFNVSREGSQGPHVQWAQRKLRVAVDGSFGPKTAQAVRDFQARKGLVVDGEINVATFAALAWE